MISMSAGSREREGVVGLDSAALVDVIVEG
jgi:hypothetical protein